MAVNELVSEETKQTSDRVMKMVKAGRIRNHKLSNTSLIHHGDLEAQELNNYMRFISTRNCYNILNLCGRNDYE